MKAFIFILFLSPYWCFSQKGKPKVSPGILNVCTRLAADNTIYSQYVGRGGASSDQWITFDSLKKACDENVFLALTDHSSPVIRGLAFEALSDKNVKLFMKTLRKHEKDTQMVRHIYGCIEGTNPLIDHVVNNFIYNNKPAHASLNAKDKKYLTALNKKAKERKDKMNKDQK